jgi:hypothetical protein
MKKLALNGMLLASLALSLASCQKDTVLPAAEIPAELTDYLNQHFSDQPVLQVIKDRDGFTKTYDIILEGGVTLEFNRSYEVIDIDGNNKLPDSVIPTKLLEYVNEKYPNSYITDWELEDKHQQVGLENGLTLEFNMDGTFLRIDA